MSLSESAESLWGAGFGVAVNTGAGKVMLSKSEAMSRIKTRRAEKPRDDLLTAPRQRSIESGRFLFTFWGKRFVS